MQLTQIKRRRVINLKPITVRIPEEWLPMLNEAVRKGFAANWNVAIRDAVRDYLKLHNLWKRQNLWKGVQVSERLMNAIEQASPSFSKGVRLPNKLK